MSLQLADASAAHADQILADLLTRPSASAAAAAASSASSASAAAGADKILSANQRTADRKRRKEKKQRLTERAAKRERKLLSDLDHVKPDFSTAEAEKRLVKIATKGGTRRKTEAFLLLFIVAGGGQKPLPIFYLSGDWLLYYGCCIWCEIDRGLPPRHSHHLIFPPSH